MNHQTQTNVTATAQPDRWVGLRGRFLQKALPVRLGELSSCLSMAKHIANQTTTEKVAFSFLTEPSLYLDWGFPDADTTLQSELNELQQFIAQVKQNWQSVWENPAERSAIGASFADWSQKMLDRSGLLNYDDWREVFRPAAPTAIKVAA